MWGIFDGRFATSELEPSKVRGVIKGNEKFFSSLFERRSGVERSDNPVGCTRVKLQIETEVIFGLFFVIYSPASVK